MRADATFCCLVGRTEDELVGALRLVDLLVAGDRIYYESYFAPMLRLNGQVSDVALVLQRPDGTRVPVLITADLDRTPSGQARHIRCRIELGEA